jgi:hypothetical protein
VREHGQPQSSGRFVRLYEALHTAPYFVRRRRNARPFSWEEWRNWCVGFDASGLFEGFVRYETDTPRDSDVMWGDKSPAYVRHIGLLLGNFPNARVIHIVRDVRDYCASVRKAWNKDIRRAAYQWRRDVFDAHLACGARPKQCIELRYEDLLHSPHSQMRKLCEFLGLRYSESMTRLEKPAEELGYATGQVEIVTGNFGKFAERLTPREIKDIESLAFDTMSILGLRPVYAQAQRTMSTAEQKLRRIKDGVRLVTHGKAKLGIAGALRFHVMHSRLAD